MPDAFFQSARFGVGVLVFNPTDDVGHLERIQKCLTSLSRAAQHAERLGVRLLLGLNQSPIEQLGITGIGPKSLAWIEEFAAARPDHVRAFSFNERNSNVWGYNVMLKKWHQESSATKICIFADDYIVPKDWFLSIDREFEHHPSADFIMPSTCFVPQQNLWVPLNLPSHWEILHSREGYPMGVRSGVTYADIDAISQKVRHLPTFRYIGPPSFETTTFTRPFFDRYGFLYDEYFTTFYNIEYFDRAIAAGARGFITRRGFVFHHGKGGTSSLYQKTRDEKYIGSPVEAKLKRDVELYNQRNNKNVSFFWQEAGKDKAPQLKHPSNLKIYGLIAKYTLMGQLKAFPGVYSFARKIYHTLKKTS